MNEKQVKESHVHDASEQLKPWTMPVQEIRIRLDHAHKHLLEYFRLDTQHDVEVANKEIEYILRSIKEE